MVRVAPIKLQYSSKSLWFDPQDLDVHKGDAVVVTTARGLEFGHMTDDVLEVEKDSVKRLKSELKPIKRLATPEDEAMASQMQEKSDEALPVFKEMAAESGGDMHPVSVEFLLDGDKAVFYFEAEERVDFRDLVRKLAAHFRVRIDMRQIGVRDEARMVGGLGHCGQELCCKRLGGEFCPVSIRMAKEQDLSLNPQKISGVCGRLMCCLRYEFDVYKDFKERAPKINGTIDTPEGSGRVVDLNVPREIVSIKLEDDKTIKVPLAEMEPAEKGARPNKIGKKAFDHYANQNIFDSVDSIPLSPFGDKGLFDGPMKKDRQGDGAQPSHKGQGTEGGRKPRRRGRTAQAAQGAGLATDGAPNAEGQQKKPGQKGPKGQGQQRRPGGGQEKGNANAQRGQGQPKKRKGKGAGKGKGQGQQGQGLQGRSGPQSDQQKQGLRPGQKSSGLRNAEARNDSRSPQGRQQRPPQQQGRKEPQGGGEAEQHRRSRSRSHKSGGPGPGGTGE